MSTDALSLSGCLRMCPEISKISVWLLFCLLLIHFRCCFFFFYYQLTVVIIKRRHSIVRQETYILEANGQDNA